MGVEASAAAAEGLVTNATPTGGGSPKRYVDLAIFQWGIAYLLLNVICGHCLQPRQRSVV
jgi:hypothetical protein